MSTEAEQNIQTWKIKKLIKSLDSARGYVISQFSSARRLVLCSDHDDRAALERP
jgi:transposase